MSAVTTTPILRAEAVGKKFGGFTALQGVSVDFFSDRLTSIIGPNGAGKSTFFNVLSGAFAPTSGKIFFQGEEITGLPQHRFAHRGIAKSFQITNLFPQLSVLENVRVAAQAMRTTFDLWSPRWRLRELTDKAEACSRWSASRTGDTSRPAISPTATSARSRSRWRWPATRACSCSTSRPPA
jgi:ABC-type branched-subunit amino acid transport system ATPase component